MRDWYGLMTARQTVAFDQLGFHTHYNFGSTNHCIVFGVAPNSTHNHQPMKR